jgi:SAM-dependent methyltransferase
VIYSDVIAGYKRLAREEDAVAQAIIEALGPNYPGSLVDLGSGPGVVLRNLRRAGFAGRFLAIDIEPQSVSDDIDVEFMQANAVNWTPSAESRPDVALLSHVLPDISPVVRAQLLSRLVATCKHCVLIATNRMDSLFGKFLLSLWQSTDGFNHYLDWPMLAKVGRVSVVRRIEFCVTAEIGKEDFAKCAQLFTPNSVAPEAALEIIEQFWPGGDYMRLEIPQNLYVLQPTTSVVTYSPSSQIDPRYMY